MAGLSGANATPARPTKKIKELRTCPTFGFGGPDKMLDYLEVVHVLVRGPHSSGSALSEVGKAHQGDHQAVELIDCFDGLVVSWSIGTRPDAELVNTMLDSAIESVADCDERPVVHSDRGAHYRWPGWLSRMRDARLVRSMSRKGCSPDNAACEGFFGRLKTELFYPRDWRAATIDQFIEVLDSYIRWYNATRIKVSLGSLSPLEYRESLGIAA
jgi:transposase InsO family protein